MTPAAAIDWARVPLGPGVSLLRAHPCGLAALGKPEKVLSHPNKRGEEARSLLNARYDEGEECFSWPDADGTMQRVWLLHRLDSATSGVLLVAATREVAEGVRHAFENRHVHKRYLAVVLGHPRERSTLWRDAMDVKDASGKVRAGRAGALEAETVMKTLRLIPGPPALAAIELEPRTGRTHQLRHQCARRRLPILGDQNYGNFPLNRELARRFGTDRLFLHAHRVEVEFSLGAQRISFSAEAPPPEAFAGFLKK